MPRRSGSLLPVVVIAVLLLFFVGIYMITAAPTVSKTSDQLNSTGGDAIDEQGLRPAFGFAKDVALIYAPLMFLFAAIAWVYASVAGRESGGGVR